MRKIMKQISVEKIQGISVVTFHQSRYHNQTESGLVGDEMLSLVTENCKIKVLLDFDGVTYLSSVFLGKLIQLDKKTKAAGGKLRMCSLHPDISEVFSMTALDDIFRIFPDKFTALEGF